MPLMVLNQQDWENRIHDFPYGGINSSNNCLHFPADLDHQFTKIISPIYETSPFHLQQKLVEMVEEETPFIKGFNIFFDGKIVHELGHVFVNISGIDFGSRWFTEFFVDYSNYAFLKRYSEEYRDLLEMQELMPQIMYEGGLAHANYTLSDDFDRLYSGMGWPNAVWFYGRGMLAVLQLYEDEGEDFIGDIVKAYGKQDEKSVEEIDSIILLLESWFIEWLNYHT
jgi:hypothetical protein